jgi:hypothetical protein
MKEKERYKKLRNKLSKRKQKVLLKLPEMKKRLLDKQE